MFPESQTLCAVQTQDSKQVTIAFSEGYLLDAGFITKIANISDSPPADLSRPTPYLGSSSFVPAPPPKAPSPVPPPKEVSATTMHACLQALNLLLAYKVKFWRAAGICNC